MFSKLRNLFKKAEAKEWNWYVDWDKVNTHEDLIKVLKHFPCTMNIRVTNPVILEDDSFKHFLTWRSE